MLELSSLKNDCLFRKNGSYETTKWYLDNRTFIDSQLLILTNFAVSLSVKKKEYCVKNIFNSFLFNSLIIFKVITVYFGDIYSIFFFFLH